MPAAAEENAARPESHPKRLLFLAALPPEVSTKDRLGRRRQSRAYISAASRNMGESSAAGQLPCAKKARRKARRESLAGSLRCSAVVGFADSAWVPGAGRETTPAKTAKPFESSFRISSISFLKFVFLKSRP